MFKSYYIAKLINKLQLPSFNDCKIEPTARVASGSALAKVKMGRYSYVGHNTRITDAEIGNFCSIGDNCGIGGGIHPLYFVSTSPVFLKGKNILRKNFSLFPYEASKTVRIGHDVWIGDGVFVKSGVKICSGAVIGAHAVVTKDVRPYSVVAGVPAKEINMRFDSETITKISNLEWWYWSDEQLKELSLYFDDPQKLINKIDNN